MVPVLDRNTFQVSVKWQLVSQMRLHDPKQFDGSYPDTPILKSGPFQGGHPFE